MVHKLLQFLIYLCVTSKMIVCYQTPLIIFYITADFLRQKIAFQCGKPQCFLVWLQTIDNARNGSTRSYRTANKIEYFVLVGQYFFTAFYGKFIGSAFGNQIKSAEFFF